MPVAFDLLFPLRVFVFSREESSSLLAGICAWFTVFLKLKITRLLKSFISVCRISINSPLSRIVSLPSLQGPRCPLVLSPSSSIFLQNPKYPAGVGEESPVSTVWDPHGAPSKLLNRVPVFCRLPGSTFSQMWWHILSLFLSLRWGLACFSLLTPCTVCFPSLLTWV